MMPVEAAALSETVQPIRVERVEPIEVERVELLPEKRPISP
jgi:hypothetical protein